MIANIYTRINRTIGFVTLCCLSAALITGMGINQLNAQCTVASGPFTVGVDANPSGNGFLNAAELNSAGAGIDPGCDFIRYYDAATGGNLLYTEEIGVDPGLARSCGTFTIFFEVDSSAAVNEPSSREEVTFTVTDPVLILPAADAFDITYDCGVDPGVVSTYLSGIQMDIEASSSSNCNDIDAVWIVGSADTVSNTCVGNQREVVIEHRFEVTNNHGETENYFVSVTYVDDEAPEWETPPSSPGATTYNAGTTTQEVSLNCNDGSFTMDLDFWQNFTPTATDNCNEDNINITLVSDDTETPLSSGSCPAYSEQTKLWVVDDGCVESTDTFRLIITLEDDEVPVVTSAPDTVDVFTNPPGVTNCEFTFTDELEITATDCRAFTSDWSVSIATTGNIVANGTGTGLSANPTLEVGEYEITYLLDDGCNQNDTTIYIRVINNNGLDVTCPSNIGPVTFLANECFNTVTWDRPEVTGFCIGDYGDRFIEATIVNLTNQDSSNSVVDPIDADPDGVSAQVSEGEWEVVYYFEDELGDPYGCSFTILVEDDIAATFVSCTTPSDIAACDSTTVPDLTPPLNCPATVDSVVQTPAPGTYLVDVPGLTVAENETFDVTIISYSLFATDTCVKTVTLGPANSGPTPNVASLPAVNPDTDLAAGCGVISILRPTATSCSGQTVLGTASDGGIDPSDSDRWVINADFGPADIVWTYTDGLSSSTQTQNIEVTNDIRNPLVNCPGDVTVDTDMGECEATNLTGLGMTFVAPSTPYASTSLSPGQYTDDCDASPEVSFDIDGGGFTLGTDAGAGTFALGDNVVTYQVEDADNNSATCTFTVTVEDNEGPTFTCPGSQTLLTSNLGTGDCSIIFDDTFDPTNVADNCDPDPTVSWSTPGFLNPLGLTMSPSSGSTLDGVEADIFPNFFGFGLGAGQVTVQWAVEDNAGNVSTCNVTYTIFDDEDPEIECPSDTTVSYIDDGQANTVCGYLVSGGEFDFTSVDDNCDTNTPEYSVTGATTASGSSSLDGNTLNIGDHVVTWEVSDPQGNTDDCSFTVTVQDDQRPHIDFTTMQNCGDTINVVSTGAECNPPVSWEQPILDLSLFECSDLNQVTRTVAGDGINGPEPAYDVENDILAYVSAGFNLGTTEIVYYFQDEFGNDTTCQITVVVEDTIAPQLLTCAGSVDLNGICDSVAIGDLRSNATFSENCVSFTVFQDPDPSTLRIDANGGQSLTDGDDITVSVWAEDGSGNVSDTCYLTVTFFENDNPIPTVSPLPTLTPDDSLDIACGFVELAAPTATNCNGDVILGVPSGGGSLTDVNGDSTVWLIQNPTPITVTWTYSSGGNITMQNQTIEFEDNDRDPQVECYPNQAFSVVSGCTYNPNNPNPGVLEFSYISPTAPYNAMVLNAGEFTDICDDNPTVSWEVTGATTGSETNTNPGDFDYNVGVNTVTVTVTDDQGQNATCSFTVTVGDNIAPMFTSCPGNQNVNTDLDECFATVTGIGVTVDENCEIDSISYVITGVTTGSGLDDASGTEFEVGTSTVTYTAVDTSGNFSTCQFTVDVTDNQDPAITCSTLDPAYDTDMGECDFTVPGTDFDPTTSDNCGVQSVTNDFNNSSSLENAVFPVGSTDVVWTVTDDNSNTNTCQITVNVEDNELPVLDCNADTTYNLVTSDCFRNIDFAVDPSDNCGIDVNTFNISSDNPNTIINPGGGNPLKVDASGNYFFNANVDLGVTEFTYTIDDVHGNTSLPCVFTVTLLDTIRPILNNCNSTATVNSICDDVDLPSFAGNADITDNCDSLVYYQDPAEGMDLIDANGGVSLTDGDQITVKVWAEDKSGNVSDTCEVTVTFNADDAPVPAVSSLPGINPGNTLEAGCGPYAIDAPIATTCNGDTIYATTGGAGITDLGTTPPSYLFDNFNGNVIWGYDDGFGNTASQNQNIQVTSDTAAPFVVCPGDISVNTDSGQCSAVPNNTGGVDLEMTYVDPTSFFPPYPPAAGLNAGEYTDNCDTDPDVEFEFSGATTFGPAAITGNNPDGETFNAGVTTVTVTVTDADNNTASCSYNVTVNDNEAPMFTSCPGNQNVNTDLDECFATVTGIGVTVDENCEIDSISYVITGITSGSGLNNASGTEFNVGSSTVTYTAVDTSGNFSTCQFTVDVTDNQDPAITCASLDPAYDTDMGECDLTVVADEFDPTVSDNCGIQSVTNDYNMSSSLDGAVFQLGDTDVLWTVTDVNGNTNTCQITVTVEDNEAPQITCNPNDTISIGGCELNSHDFPIDVFENCELDMSGFTTSSIDNGGSFETGGGSEIKVDGGGNLFFEANIEKGLTTISYTLSDTAGNESSPCTFTVLLQDNRPTVVNCQVTPSVDLDSNGVADIPQSLVLNNYDGFCAPVDTVHYPTSVDCTDGDDVLVTVVISDDAGNLDSCQVSLAINDPVFPTASCVDTFDVSLDSNGDAVITTDDINDGSDDNTSPLCTLALSLDITDFDCNDVGPNDVVLSVEDVYGNVSTCESVVNVIDDENPSIDCPSAIVANTDPGVCTYNLANDLGSLEPSSLDDNCGIDSVSYEIFGSTSGSGLSPLTTVDFNLGTSSVVFTATDVNGNTSSCSVGISVTDNEAPVANTGICGQIDTVDTDAGDCFATIDYDFVTDDWFSDNCTANENLFYTGVITNPDMSTTSFSGGDPTLTFFVGASTLEVYAEDASGNTSLACTNTIEVEDNELPDPGCPMNISYGTAVDCDAIIEITFSASDNCGLERDSFDLTFNNPSHSTNIISSDWRERIENNDPVQIEFGTGTTDVTLYVEDVHGNGNSCTFEVSVTSDTTDLDIDCLANRTVELDSNGVHEFSGVDNLYTINSGACAPISVFYDPPVVDCSFGTSVDVEVIVVDNAGKSDTCTNVVTIEDNILPEPRCVSAYVVELDSTGNQSITTDDIDDGSDDNTFPACGLDLSLNVDQFDCSDIGFVDVWLTVVDTFGNEDSCMVTVSVEDNIDPVVLCPNNVNVDTDPDMCTAEVNDIEPDSTWENCTIDSITYVFAGATAGSGMDDASGTAFELGTTTVTYTIYDDSGNTSNCSFDVTVEDNQAPDITCATQDTIVGTSEDGMPGDCVFSISGANEAAFSASATDNCAMPPTVTHNISGLASNESLVGFDAPLGPTTIIWTADDGNGNTSACSFVLTVEDDEDPTAGCPGDINITNAAGCNAVRFIGVNADDNCGVDYSTFSISFDHPDAGLTDENTPVGDQAQTGQIQVQFPTGSTLVTYYVEDESGNSDECSFTVTATEGVNDGTLQCADNRVFDLNQNGVHEFIENDIVDNYLNFCDSITTVFDPPVLNCTFGTSTTVEVIAFDNAGNDDTCTVTVFIEDNIDPVAECLATLDVFLDGNGQATLDSNALDNGSFDNTILSTPSCDIEFEIQQSEFDCSDLGTFSIWQVVTDVYDNTDTCYTSVTVLDTISPEVTCPSDVVVSNDPGECSAVVNGIEPLNVSDNCTVTDTSYTFTGDLIGSGSGDASGTVFPVGTTTVEYTISDQSSNSVTCDFTVTVNDTEPPAITCAFNPDTVVTTSGDGIPGDCFYTVLANEFDATATDNCAVDSVWNDLNNAASLQGEDLGVGTHTIRWYAVDIHNNIDSCDITVEVEDDELPDPGCPSNQIFSNASGCGDTYQLGISAFDNCALDSSSFDITFNRSDASISNVLDDHLADGSVTFNLPVGITEVTYFIEDVNGNSNSCTYTIGVTVGDPNANVTLECEDNLDVYLDQNGEYEFEENDLIDVINGFCEPKTTTHTPAFVNCENRPEITVQVKVEDDGGRQDSCTTTVTILDTIPPVALCQDTTIYLDENGEYTIDSSYVDNGSSDNADLCGLTMDLSETNFNCEDVGDNPVILTVTDVFNNASTCDATVTVVDSIAPDIACVSNQAQFNDPGECGAVVNDIGLLLAEDNCDIDTIEYTLSGATTASGGDDASGEFFNVGTTNVLYTVTDVNGNVSTCDFDVVVTDNEVPDITSPFSTGDTLVFTSGDNVNYECFYQAIATEFDATATDNCQVDSVWNNWNNTSTLEGEQFAPGTHDIRWYAVDIYGNIDSIDTQITVEDDEDPMVTCQDSVNLNANSGCDASRQFDIEFEDNCAIDASSFEYFTDNPDVNEVSVNNLTEDGVQVTLEFPVGTTTVGWVIQDIYGNADTCYTVVNVTTTSGPIANCVDNFTAILDENGEYEPRPQDLLTNYTPGSSSCGIDTVFFSPDVLDCTDRPTTDVTVTVMDVAGLTDVCVVPVTITDTIPPVAECQDTTIYLDEFGFYTIDSSYINNGSTDNADLCGLTMDLSSVEFDCDDITTSPNPVTLTVTDVFGNSHECIGNVTVLDTVPPTVECPMDVVQTNDAGECGAIVDNIGLDADDNCEVDSWSYTLSGATTGTGSGDADSTFFVAGTTTVTYTAEDLYGNTASCSFNVTITDDEDPVIVCSADTMVTTSGDGLPDYDCLYVTQGSEFDPVLIDDNCMVDSWSNSENNGTSLEGVAFEAGTHTVTWTVLDTAGNSNTCDIVIQVVDDQAPQLSNCPVDTTIQSAGNCGTLYSWNIPDSIDNCEIETMVVYSPDRPGFHINTNDPDEHKATFPVGTTTIEYILTDTTGNADSCSFVVTVTGAPGAQEGPEITCQSTPYDAYLDSDGIFVIDTSMFPEYGVFTEAGECAISNKWVGQDTLTCADRPQVQVTFYVNDLAGNVDSCQKTFNIIDTIAPVAECMDATIYLDATGFKMIDETYVDNGTSDNAEACGLTFDLSETTFGCGDIWDPVSVSMVVTDVFGNVDSCSAYVTVQDTVSPEVTCPESITDFDNDQGECGAVVDMINLIATDACGVETIEWSTTGATSISGSDDISGQFFNVGVTDVTYTATDSSGNSSSCGFSIEVVDTEAPVVTCPENQTRGTSEDNLGLYDCGYTTQSTEFDYTNLDDNCTVDTFYHNQSGAASAQSLDEFVFGLGTTQVVWTAIDEAGNSTTCTFTVTVEDDEAPDFQGTCPSDTTINSTLTSCDALFVWDTPVAVDNCQMDTTTEEAVDPSGNPLAISMNTSTSRQAMFPAGTSTVTYVATDAADNSTVCEFDVTVTNTGTGPTAICLNTPDIVLDANGQATIEPEDINPTYGTAGNCPLADVYVTPSNINCGNLDEVLVTLTVVDFAGGSDECQVTLNVIDDMDPVAECDDHTVEISGGSATVEPSDIDDGSSDNCNITGYELSRNNSDWLSSLTFDCSELGIQQVYLRVTDQSGNSDVCDATVTVEDNTDPVVSCPSDVTVGTSTSGDFDCVGSHNWTIPTASDNCGVLSYTQTLTGATEAGPESVMGQGGQSTSAQFNLGTTTVTYNVTDVDGNTASCSFDVTVEDDEVPTIDCPEDQVFNTSEDGSGDCTFTVSDNSLDATATDNCTGVGSVENDFNNSSTLEGATFDEGVTTVVWSVSDATGDNSADCSFTVTVNDDEAPTFSYCPPSVTIATVGPGACNNSHTWQAPMAADIDDNCGIDDVTEFVETSYGPITVTPTGYDHNDPSKQERTALFPIGTTTVSYTAVDDSGNETVCSFEVTITEDVPPNAQCQDVTVYLDASGSASITAEEVDNNSTDNCEIASLDVSPSTFGCDDVGSNTVTLTVTDYSDNSAECTANVTVIDTIPPMAVCQDISVNLDADGDVVVDAEDLDANAGGNCSITDYEISVDNGASYSASESFNCGDLGTVDAILRITDQNSNQSTCSASITVQDEIAPQVECPANATVQTSSNGTGDCTGSFTWTVPVASDNCNVTLLEAQLTGATTGTIDQLDDQGQSVTADFNEGVTTVTYYVEDQSGNSNECSLTVTVQDDENPTLEGPTSAEVATSQDGGGDCFYTASGSEFDPTSFDDNCDLSNLPVHNYSGPGVLSNTTLAGARFPIGSTSVTWTLTDDAGNATSYNLVVFVEDDEAPIFHTCPSDYVVNASNFNCNQNVSWTLPYAISDNCGLLDVEEHFSDPYINPVHDYNYFDQAGNTGLALFSAGVTTVTYTATDVNGLESVCEFTVTVLDNQAPIVNNCPSNATISSLCEDTELPDWTGQVSVTDNCTGNQEITQSPAPGTLLGDIAGLNLEDGETISVTVTATDLSANYLSGSCTFEVTLVNDSDPQPVTPGPLLPNYNAVACDGSSAIVVAPLASVDGCNGASEVSGQLVPIPSGVTNNGDGTYTFPNGFDAMVTWVYTNGPNQASQLQQVTVSADDNPPVAVCQSATVSLNSAGSGSLTAGMVDGGSFDNECGIASTSVDQTTFNCGDLGSNTVTLTVTDENGNTDECTATVTVVDQINPVASCKNASIELGADESVTLDPALIDNGSFDNCSDISLSASPATFGCEDTGVNSVLLTVTDGSGNSATCNATVMVYNNLPPALECHDVDVTLDANGQATISIEMVSTISNPCDADYTASVSKTSFNCGDVGANTVTVTASNSDNNEVSTCTATVTVSDDTAPVITSCPNNVFTCNAGVEIPAAVATDNCGNVDITYVLSGAVSGSGDGSQPIEDVHFPHGTTTITYTATDNSGNESTCQTTVNIDNTTEPTTICINDLNVNLGSSGMITIDAEFFDASSFDPDCPDTELYFEMSVNGGSLAEMHDFDCSHIGANVIQLIAYDGAGNSGSCQTTLNVFDVSPPTAVCNGGVTLELDGNGNAQLDPSDLDGGSSDNCAISFDASQTSFDCSDIGTNSVVLTVTDSGGNTATCQTSVTVEDNLGPVALCDNPVFVINNPNHALILEPSDVDAGSHANCGGIDMDISPYVFTCSNEGVNTVVLTVTDDEGRVSTCESNVTITCQEGTFVVSGRIETEWGEPVDQVTVDMSGTYNSSQVTATNGNYSFLVETGNDITVTPTRDINYLEGVSTLDLVLIQRHILQIQSLDSPYKIIAGDANKDGQLSVIDLVQLINLIVGNIDELPDNDSWRFVFEDFDFTDPTNPFADDFPEFVEYLDLNEDQKGQDYIAVKVGDVTDDFGQSQSTQNRSLRSLYMMDRNLEQGEVINVPVRINRIDQAVGYQFGLEFDTDAIEFVDVAFSQELSNIMQANFSDRFAEEGVIRTNWFNAKSMDLEEGMELMTLRFRVTGDNVKLSDVIDIENERFHSEAYDNLGESYNLGIEFIESGITGDAFELFQNQPNPFANETVIGFILPDEMDVTIEIIDETGRLIRSYNLDGAEGYNQLRVDSENLSSGLYYYRLVSDRYNAVKRMILQND